MPPEAIFALPPDSADIIVTGIHLQQQVGDFFRGILQVGIQGQDIVPSGAFKTRNQRRMLSGVGAQKDYAGGIGVKLKLLAE